MIIAFIRKSKENRQMTADQLANHFFPEGDVSGIMVVNALKKKTFSRRIALRKSGLSRKHRQARLQWALNHVD